MIHGISFSRARYKQLVRIAVDRRLSAVKLRACRRVRLEVIGSSGRTAVESAMEQRA